MKYFRRLNVIIMINIFKSLFKRKNQKVEEDETAAAPNIKCKDCEMLFRNKETLEIHKKKAHSGRGERKKPS